MFVCMRGDEVCIFLTDEFLFGKVDYEVVYEDENILLVNKPAGISVVEEDGSFCLTSVLQERHGQHDMLPLQADAPKGTSFPYPCHRIDRNTSGLVLFAKNKLSLDILFEKFKNKEIEKHYYCIVLRKA